MRKQEAVPVATQNSPNLYERLGGVYSIATVVDDLIDRVMADPRLNANPLVDDAHHKVPPAGFDEVQDAARVLAHLASTSSSMRSIRETLVFMGVFPILFPLAHSVCPVASHSVGNLV